MKNRYTYLLLVAAAAIAVFMSSCGNRAAVAVTEGDTLYLPAYAEGFLVTQDEGGRVLNIYDPWQGAEGVTTQVFLPDEGSVAPKGFRGTVLKTPLKKVVCMSSTYVAYINELGRTDAIRGVSGAKYISNPLVRDAYAAGTVAEVGFDAGINYELLAAMKPDVVFAYGITGENSVMSSKLANLGIDLVYIGDYVENSPLGKAEWLVAFGYLFGLEEMAMEAFGNIEAQYNDFKGMAAGVITGDKPVVMLNSPYRDTWFVPGDRSYMVRLIEDAGGIYACAGEDSDQSRPISLEDAYVRMLGADVWLNPGLATTLAEMKAENPRFTRTPPVLNGKVYNNNKRQTPEGGSDFWESGAVRPDIVLADMVRILHPDMPATEGSSGPVGELFYFRRLE